MNNMKRKSAALLLSLLGATMLIQSSAKAQLGSVLGETWGTAWTIGNVILGQTTITPAYAVESHTWYYKEMETQHSPNYFSGTRKVTRDLLGQYFYYTKAQTAWSVEEWSDPFPVGSVNKLNLICQRDLGEGNIVTVIQHETHTERVWFASVVSTGLWPDNGPWTVYLKTLGYKVGCPPYTPYETYFWVPATLRRGEFKIVSLGKPDCVLNYPFYLTHEFYK